MKKLFKKRFLSLLLALLMLFSIVPFNSIVGTDFFTTKAFAKSSTKQITSIEIPKVTLIENYDGYLVNDYWYEDDATQESFTGSYFYYSVYSQTFIVKYSDGSSLKCDEMDLYDLIDCSLYYETDQSYNNQWGLGEHTATAYFNEELSTEFTVEIIKSPVKDIEVTVNKNKYIEGKDGFLSYYMNEDGYIQDEYFYYNLDLDVKVIFEDGFDGDQYDYYIDDGQSSYNPWDIGRHTVTVSSYGFEKEIEVEVVKNTNPIVNISVVKANKLIENFDGYETSYSFYDKNKGDWVEKTYFEYNTYDSNPVIKITFADGTTFEGFADEIYDSTGYEAQIYDKQSYNNQWSLGKHTAYINVGKITVPFGVEVVENGCKIFSIEAKNNVILGQYVNLSITVEGNPNKIQFVGSNNFTVTFARTHENVIDIIDNGNGTETWDLWLKVYSKSENYTVFTKYSNGWLKNGYSYSLKITPRVTAVKLNTKSVETNCFNSFSLTPEIESVENPKYTVEYTSSNPSIATVDQNGNVKSVGRGSAKITVTVSDYNGNTVTDTCNVNVKFSFVQWFWYVICFGWIWM